MSRADCTDCLRRGLPWAIFSALFLACGGEATLAQQAWSQWQEPAHQFGPDADLSGSHHHAGYDSRYHEPQGESAYQPLPYMDHSPATQPSHAVTGYPASVPTFPTLPEQRDAPVEQGAFFHPVFAPQVDWEHSFELGLSGSEGNSETFNFRMGYHGKRASLRHETTWGVDYKNESAAGTTTADKLFFEGRHEWLFDDSPWSIYVRTTYEFDEFAAFDSRLAVDAGFGYLFWESDIDKFKGRIGSGVSKEFGSPDDDWKPEAVFGLEYTRQLSDRQKLVLATDYFPEYSNFANSRIVSKADWEILIDEAWNMSLKLGLRNRYDSTPSGAKHNDLDYSAVLLWRY